VTQDEQAQKRPLFPKWIGLDPGSHFRHGIHTETDLLCGADAERVSKLNHTRKGRPAGTAVRSERL
jgi:hypothetical protein